MAFFTVTYLVILVMTPCDSSFTQQQISKIQSLAAISGEKRVVTAFTSAASKDYI